MTLTDDGRGDSGEAGGEGLGSWDEHTRSRDSVVSSSSSSSSSSMSPMLVTLYVKSCSSYLQNNLLA